MTSTLDLIRQHVADAKRMGARFVKLPTEDAAMLLELAEAAEATGDLVNSADFIAAARTYLPKLIAVAEAAKEVDVLVASDAPFFRPIREALAALEAE